VHGIGVKEKWFGLVSMISGLAASIEASGMLTAATNAIAAALEICNEKHCYHPWMFVLVQVCLAIVTTIILIPVLIPLVPPFLWSEDQEEPQGITPLEYVSQVSEDAISLLSPNQSSNSKKSRYDSV
jgi:hypothetical protein